MKISKIKLNKDNPRLIKDERFKRLIDSIKDFPKMMSLRPIVIDAEGTILGGNMRYKALKELGYKDIPDDWVKQAQELTDDERERFIIEDNVPFGDWDWTILESEWDQDKLIEWGLELPDDWGSEPEEGLTDDDAIPDEVDPICKLGDLWQLGDHRLLCGDSTKAEDVERLMDGEKADMVFTSPPYNAGKTPTELKAGKKSKYLNDLDNKSSTEYLSLLESSTLIALEYCQYVFVNVQSLSGNKLSLIDFLYDMKSKYAETIIWDKQTAQPAMAENVLNSQYEYIHCFSQKSNRHIGTRYFRGTLSNVINISKQSENKIKEHNAIFPTSLALHFVENFSDSSIYDPFIGSGTTLIACEKLSRKCYGMELDPHYCDVIIKRWEDFTGNKAVKQK